VARITRKQLKSDRFAVEVEHTVEYVAEHKKQVLRYSLAALVVLLIASGIYFYRGQQHAARQEELAKAIQIQEAPVSPPQPTGSLSFATQDEKNKQATKAFSDILAKYPGTDEGTIAANYLGAIAVDQGKLTDAEKYFKQAVDSGSKTYKPVAKLSLAQVYIAQGRAADGEKLLRDIIANPSILVSKQEATIALARAIANTRPEEARKLLEPLKSQPGAASQIAITASSEIPK
jgi:predicted Zn-dependent protease